MSNKNILDYLTVSSTLVIIGIIILIAGIYYSIHGGISSGVTMGRYGRPYGTGTIDGNGMIFIAVLFIGFGYSMRDKKKTE